MAEKSGRHPQIVRRTGFRWVPILYIERTDTGGIKPRICLFHSLDVFREIFFRHNLFRENPVSLF